MIGKVLGKRYELIEKIGEGGMGLVYKAKCHLLNRYVAVKILKPELTGDEEFINKFKKESLSSASLSHPNIVNIYDVGVEDGIYYIVMEYVKGKTLKEIIQEKAPMPYYEIINICRQICLGLDHAHNNKIIHRDIKPQNILITHDGIVKVADFGIARASNSATLTNTGNVLGSVYYISPEQARGGYTDEKTDIYSLGTVMYELATGKVPFMAESPVVIALKHIQEDVVKPCELNHDIPVALEDIILKSLEKNPALRYESASSVIKDLDKASANPNTRLLSRHESSNDITRVLPAIKDDYLKDSTREIKHKTNRIHRGWIAAGVVLFTMITVAGLLLYGAYGNPGNNKDVPVPNIIGYDEKTAEKILKTYSINMQVLENRNDSKPQGTIIKTTPSVGMLVKQNSVVKVIVSLGPLKVQVPSVIGLSVDEAVLKLHERGLDKGNTIDMLDEKVEKDKIVRQSPEADTEIADGMVVDLYVSRGPEVKFREVPMLEGVSLDKVEAVLKEAKLILGSTQYKRDPSKPDNVVLFQSVPYKTQVKEGSPIDITVNKVNPAIPATY